MWYIILIIIIACEPLPTSPFDSGYEKDLWTPTDFQIEVVSVSEVKLSWAQEEMNITGFKIDRKIGEDDWIIAYAILNKDQTSWGDESPSLESTTYYRLYAYANEHISIYVEENINLEFPPPTNLESQAISLYEIKLDWSDNSSGEDGFKIDRKLGNEDWGTEYGTVVENDITWTDMNAVPNTIINYRVYAFIDAYNSAYVEKEVIVTINEPSNLEVIQLSLNSVKLIWIDNSEGEEGFKIDRKVENGTWVNQYSSTGENTEVLFDIDIDLWNRYYYRVYAFFQDYVSLSIEDSLLVKTSDRIRLVPFEYPTIFQAMHSVEEGFIISDGDTILVFPGFYDTNISFYGYDIVLGSLFLVTGEKAYISQTILDGGSRTFVIDIISGESASALITGFTIQNGGSLTFYGGVNISDSSPTIIYNIIQENSDGIRCYRSSSVIRNNNIINNRSVGIRCWYAEGNSSPTLQNNITCNNNIGLDIQYTPTTIVNNTICNNSIGLRVNLASPIIENSIFSSNSENQQFFGSNSVTIKYTCFPNEFPSGVIDGGGNIFEDPLFIGEGDYHLHIDSPCRDSGNPSDLFNDTDGSRNDMGAFGGPYGNW